MFEQLNELYQQVILDHSKSPRNFGRLPDANRQAEGNNPLCGDRFTVYMKIEGGAIHDIRFHGSGCAISKAAASLMTEQLKGRNVSEAEKIFHEYQQMIKTGRADEDTLGKLAIFAGVHRFPGRIKCAVLPWHAAMASLAGNKDTVSTEHNGNI